MSVNTQTDSNLMQTLSTNATVTQPVACNPLDMNPKTRQRATNPRTIAEIDYDTASIMNNLAQTNEPENYDEHFLENHHLMGLTRSIESTQASLDHHNIAHNKPYEYFYFCSGGALTIGYGTKIEFNQSTGQLHKEGREVLEHLDMRLNGRALTMQEKEELVTECFERRDAYNENIIAEFKKNPQKLIKGRKKKGPWKAEDFFLERKSGENQVDDLYPSGEKAVISNATALHVSHMEYAHKINKLIADKSFFDRSYLLKALAADFVYQYGTKGFKDNFALYKADGPISLGELKSQSSFSGDDDRSKMRQLLLDTAITNMKDAQKRKNKPATPESQEAFCLKALANFSEKFHGGIMLRQEHKMVMMEQYMTIVMMQAFENVKGSKLTQEEIKTAHQNARNLVYNECYNSPIIQQMPHQIKPATLTTAIEERMKIKPGKEALDVLRDALFEQAQIQIKRYNKKNKTNIQIENPHTSETNDEVAQVSSKKPLGEKVNVDDTPVCGRNDLHERW